MRRVKPSKGSSNSAREKEERFNYIIENDDPRYEIEIGSDKRNLNDDRLELLFDFGMIDDEYRVRLKIRGEVFDPRYSGYILELFGPEIDEEHEEESRAWLRKYWRQSGVTTPYQVRCKRISEKPGQMGIITFPDMYVWIRRVWLTDKKLVIEQIWNPLQGWIKTSNINRIPPECRMEEVQNLAKSLLSVSEPARPGPKSIDKVKRGEETFTKAVEEYRKYLNQHNEPPKPKTLIRLVGRSKSRFYDDLDACGCTVDDIKDQALESPAKTPKK